MTFSDHFKHSITAICTAIVFLGAGWFGLRHIIAGQPQGVALRPQDREHIAYNSTSHILTVTTDKGTTRSYVRNPDILIEKSGAIIVKKHLFGFERVAFIGIGYSQKQTAYLGLNLVNFWRLDFGPAISYDTNRLNLVAMLGYNFYSNTSLEIGYGIRQDINVGLAVRF